MKELSPNNKFEESGENSIEKERWMKEAEELKEKFQIIKDKVGRMKVNERVIEKANEIRAEYGRENVHKFILWHILGGSDFEKEDVLYFDFPKKGCSVKDFIDEMYEEYIAPDKQNIELKEGKDDDKKL